MSSGLPRGRARLLLWWLPVVMAVGVAAPFVPVGGGPPPPAAAAGAPVDGRAVYEAHCASCHGEQGQGSDRAPSLKGVGEGMVDFMLTTGRMPKRSPAHAEPPYTPSFSPAVISALDRYVTQIAAHGGPGIPKVDPSLGDVGAGGNLYRIYCAACHGYAGAGGQLTSRAVPTPVEATPTQIAEAVRGGPAQMPRFGPAAITDKDLNSVAAYVRYLRHTADRGGNPLSHVGPVAEGVAAWLLGMVVLLGFIRWIGKRG